MRNIELRYRQQFALYDSLFWMPTDIRIEGGFNLSMIGLSLPRIGIDLVSTIYDYDLNGPIPNSMSEKPRVSVDSSAAVYDSTFWRNNEVLPLTPGEQRAYRTLDSTQTLARQFQPGGALAVLAGEGTDVLLNSLDVRFDRVEGPFLGADLAVDRLLPSLAARGAAGYGISDKRFKYRLSATLFDSKKRLFGIGGEWYSRIGYVPDGEFYGPVAISIISLLFKNDYRDYFLENGWRVFLRSAPSRQLDAALSFIAEQDYSLDAATEYSLFSRSGHYRVNPPVSEGAMRSVRFDLRLGPPRSPFDIVSRSALELSVERSSPRIWGSEFDFTRYWAELTWSVNTFAPDLLFPPSLRVIASGGLGLGAVPTQRMFRPDSRASGYAPFGVLRGADVKEFGGDKFVMISAEHNFRNIPFLALNIPFLYRNGMEVILGGSVARTWVRSNPAAEGWYAEAGAGVNRILDLFRADVTYRMKEPRGWFFTVSIGTLF